MRLAAAPGYCCEHWRDVCACRTGCSGSLLLIVAIGVTIWLCRNREQRRADGKTNVGGGRLPDYCVPAECQLPGVLCPVDDQCLYRGIRNGGVGFDELLEDEARGRMGHVVQDGVRRAGGKKIAIPIGKQDATVFRKVMSAKDAI